jgi:hypothetical protein
MPRSHSARIDEAGHVVYRQDPPTGPPQSEWYRFILSPEDLYPVLGNRSRNSIPEPVTRDGPRAHARYVHTPSARWEGDIDGRRRVQDELVLGGGNDHLAQHLAQVSSHAGASFDKSAGIDSDQHVHQDIDCVHASGRYTVVTPETRKTGFASCNGGRGPLAVRPDNLQPPPRFMACTQPWYR